MKKNYTKQKSKFQNKFEYSYYNRFINYIRWSIDKYPYKSSDKLITDLFYKFKDTIILKKLWFIESYEEIIKNRKWYTNLCESVLNEYYNIANITIQYYSNNINGEKKYYKNYKLRKNDLNKIKETVNLFTDTIFQEKLELFYKDEYKIRYYIDIYKWRYKKNNYIITTLYKKGFRLDLIKKEIENFDNNYWINKYNTLINSEFQEYDKNKLKENLKKVYIKWWYNKIYEKYISNKEEKDTINKLLDEVMLEYYEEIYDNIKHRIIKFISSKNLDVNNYVDVIKLKWKFNCYNYEIINEILKELKEKRL